MEETGTPETKRTPTWLRPAEEPAPAELHHVWAPRPLHRSIAWSPTGDHRHAPDGDYEVFVKQRALESMYRHVLEAHRADEPFGFLFGDLCEDRDSRRRYVVISRVVPSPYPLFAGEAEQISEQALRILRREKERNAGALAGWYHRHRNDAALLTEDDEVTHRAHFGEPWQVAFLFVTDPDQPSGGCFQPRTYGVTAHQPLPFYEVASSASLRARGVVRTILDWDNYATETTVALEPLLRSSVPAAVPAPEPEVLVEPRDLADVPDALEETTEASADVTEASEDAPEAVFELEEVDPAPIPAGAPESEAHFEIVGGAELEEVVEEVEEEPAAEAADEEPAAEAAVPTQPPVFELDEEIDDEVEVVLDEYEGAEVREAEESAEVDEMAAETAEAEEEPASEDLVPGEVEIVSEADEPEEAEEEAATEEVAEEAAAEAEEVPIVRLVMVTATPEVEAAAQAEKEEVEATSEAEAQVEDETEEVAETQVDEAAEPAESPLPTLSEIVPKPMPMVSPVPQPMPSAAQTPRVEPEPLVAPRAPETRAREDRKAAWRSRWTTVAEILSVIVALAATGMGTWPLLSAPPFPETERATFASLAGIVLPGAGPSAAVTRFDDADPLATQGRTVRAAIGRYSTISEMFGRGRLACPPLREAYAAVGAGWADYGTTLQTTESRSAEQAERDLLVAEEVQRVEEDFSASGCGGP